MADKGEDLAATEPVQELVDQLVARSEARGDSCVELSELSELIQQADLGDEDAEIVHDMLQARGLDLRDDCGRRGVEQTAYLQRRSRGAHHRRDVAVPPGGAPLPAAHPRRGGGAGQADRAGGSRGQGAARELQPAPGDLERPQVPGPRSAAARPDSGGNPRTDPRRREVRLAQGLQVLHVRHVLDPPGDPTCAGQPRPDDPDTGPPRPARAPDRARADASLPPSSAAIPPTRRSPRPPRSASRNWARHARQSGS